MSVFDGYGVTTYRTLAAARQSIFCPCAGCTPVPPAPCGPPLDRASEYRDGRWTGALYAAGRSPVASGCAGGTARHVLLDDGLGEFDPDRVTWRDIPRGGTTPGLPPSLTIARAPPANSTSPANTASRSCIISRDGGAFECSNRQRPSGPHPLRSPVAGKRRIVRTGVYPRAISGMSSSTGREPDCKPCTRRSRRFARVGGGDGSIWIVDGATMFRLRGGRKYPWKGTGFSAANIFDVYSRKATRFGGHLGRPRALHNRLCGGNRMASRTSTCPVHAITRIPRAAMDERHLLRCWNSMAKSGPATPCPPVFAPIPWRPAAWCRFPWQDSGKSVRAVGWHGMRSWRWAPGAANLPSFAPGRPVHRHAPAAPRWWILGS